MLAYILVTCMPGMEREVIEDIKKIPDVIEVNGIMGKYDVFVKIKSSVPFKVDLSISKVRNVANVTGTITMPAIYGQGGTIDDEK